MDFIQLIDIELFEKYYHNRAVSSATYWSLIVAYSLLIVAGSIGNLLVILAVVNNKSKWSIMHTLTCQIIVQQILLFFGKNNTYSTLLAPTRLSIYDIFPSKPDFHLNK